MNEASSQARITESNMNPGLRNGKPALVFDFGGVLLDWNPRRLLIKLFDGDKAAMEKFMSEVDFFNWNFEQDRGRTFEEGVAELTARFPHYAEVIKGYDQRWEETMDGPIQSTVDTLLPLKENGYHLYALSNWSHEKYHFVDHKWPFFELFESILVSGTVKLAKPDPRFFEMMLEKIGRPAVECVFIDDSAANVDAAGRMGFRTIHYKSTNQMLDEMKQMEIDLS